MNPTIKARIESIRRGEVLEGYKRTKAGIMPVSWSKEKIYQAKDLFVSVSDKKHGGTLEVLSATQDRGIVPRRLVDIDIKYDDSNLGTYKKVDKGDFVISLRSFQGGIEYSDYVGIVSPAYTVVRAKQEIVSGYYKAYFKTEDFIKRLNIGTYGIRDGKQVSFDDFGDMVLHYPPINEQEKIAEILAGQDRVIALKEKLLAEKQKQKKYLMQQLLTAKKRLPGFSGEWKTNFLGNICDNLDNFRKPFNRDERATMKGVYPYYGANGIVDYIDRYIFDETIILLAEDGGDFENYFKKPIAQKVIGKCWVNNHAHVLRAKKDYCSEFVFYLLEHKDIRKYINGTTRSKLTKEDMQGILLYYPIDKKEQTAIAEILSTADKEIELLKKDIEQEKLKKKSLMQLLLTGIVRVDELVS